jgi:hypothetical protein
MNLVCIRVHRLVDHDGCEKPTKLVLGSQIGDKIGNAVIRSIAAQTKGLIVLFVASLLSFKLTAPTRHRVRKSKQV